MMQAGLRRRHVRHMTGLLDVETKEYTPTDPRLATPSPYSAKSGAPLPRSQLRSYSQALSWQKIRSALAMVRSCDARRPVLWMVGSLVNTEQTFSVDRDGVEMFVAF